MKIKMVQNQLRFTFSNMIRGVANGTSWWIIARAEDINKLQSAIRLQILINQIKTPWKQKELMICTWRLASLWRQLAASVGVTALAYNRCRHCWKIFDIINLGPEMLWNHKTWQWVSISQLLHEFTPESAGLWAREWEGMGQKQLLRHELWQVCHLPSQPPLQNSRAQQEIQKLSLNHNCLIWLSAEKHLTWEQGNHSTCGFNQRGKQ